MKLGSNVLKFRHLVALLKSINDSFLYIFINIFKFLLLHYKLKEMHKYSLPWTYWNKLAWNSEVLKTGCYFLNSLKLRGVIAMKLKKIKLGEKEERKYHASCKDCVKLSA